MASTRPTPSPAERARVLRLLSRMLLLTAALMLVIGVGMLAFMDDKIVGGSVLLVFLADLVMVVVTRRQARNAQREADARPGIQEF